MGYPSIISIFLLLDLAILVSLGFCLWLSDCSFPCIMALIALLQHIPGLIDELETAWKEVDAVFEDLYEKYGDQLPPEE